MEDKRITKTRKNLKHTLVDMMTEMPFEKITVKEICERAIISRITFYNYYGDKFALLEDVFGDMNDELDSRFRERQKSNTDDDPIKSYENLLDCFLDTYDEEIGKIKLEENMILLMPYYRFIVDNTTALVNRYIRRLKPNYPPEKISVFLVMGMYGYIHLAGSSSDDRKKMSESAHRLLKDLLNSGIFTSSGI